MKVGDLLYAYQTGESTYIKPNLGSTEYPVTDDKLLVGVIQEINIDDTDEDEDLKWVKVSDKYAPTKITYAPLRTNSFYFKTNPEYNYGGTQKSGIWKDILTGIGGVLGGVFGGILQSNKGVNGVDINNPVIPEPEPQRASIGEWLSENAIKIVAAVIGVVVIIFGIKAYQSNQKTKRK